MDQIRANGTNLIYYRGNMKSAISTLRARQILDSRGNPTVEVDCLLSDGSFGRASVPSGASTGTHEAVELRDNNPQHFGGAGVTKAVRHVNTTILKALKGKDARDQESIDEAMIVLDGTANKARLGANAILGVSMAVLKAHASHRRLPLYELVRALYRKKEKGKFVMPVPMMNIINGGMHAPDGPDFQEFMIMPIGAKTCAQAIEWGSTIFHALKKILHEKGLATTVGDEGGFAPAVTANEQAPRLILEAISAAGFKAGAQVALAMDAAASSFLQEGVYVLKRDQLHLTSRELIAYYQRWMQQFPFVSLEDPLGEEDWDNWSVAMETLGTKIQIVGDDIFVTNTKLLGRGIERCCANAVLVKVNQIGTITETVRAVDMARSSDWHAVVSHRSGETEDTTIADLVVGLGTGQIKTGSLSRSERTAKYNQLIRIEEELGKNVVYPGVRALQYK